MTYIIVQDRMRKVKLFCKIIFNELQQNSKSTNATERGHDMYKIAICDDNKAYYGECCALDY